MVRDGFKPGETETLLPAVIYELPVYKKHTRIITAIIIILVLILLAIIFYLYDKQIIVLNSNKEEVVLDTMAPVITLTGESSIVLGVGDTYTEQGAIAEDETDGTLTNKIEISGIVNTNQTGTYTVTYTVSDNSSNQAVATRDIFVISIGKAAMNIGTPATIYLTFDDGPSIRTTPQILDILKQKGIKATFFILDYGTKTETIVKRIVDEGHTIAIHGASHQYSVAYASADSYLNGLDYMKSKIKNSTGVETNIIRFPGGSSNTISRKYCEGVMSTLVRETINRGYRYFDWNVASGDSGDVTTAESVYNNVTQGIKNTRSNVVLMHDFNGNDKTVQALPGIIDFALSNGYKFDKITNKTPMVTQNVQN